MSNTDDKNGIPERPSFLGGGISEEHQTYGQDPQRDEQIYAKHISPKPEDQSEYSQVGGKRNSNQQYPTGQQPNNYGQGQQPENQYPVDGQNNYAQPPYNNQYGQGGYQQQNYGQPQQGGQDYSSQGGYGNYDAGQGGQNYQGQQYSSDYGSTDYSQGYQGSYDQQNYAYPAGSEGYDGYSNQPEMDDTSFLNSEYPDPGFPEKSRKSKLPMMVGAMLALGIVGGGVGYAYTNGMFALGGDSSTNKNVPVISRDNTAVKERPSDAGGREIKNKNKKIYARLGGGNSGSDNDSGATIENRTERVQDTNNDAGGSGGISMASALSSNNGDTSSDSDTDVRKVKLIPITPSNRPRKKERTGSLPGIVSSANRNGGNTDVGGNNGGATSIGDAINPTRNSNDSDTSNNNSDGETITIRRPRIGGNRSNTASNNNSNDTGTNTGSSNNNTRLASATNIGGNTRSLGSSANQDTSADGQFVIQVAARRAESDALAAFADIQQKYPDILNRFRTPIIQKADLTDRGKGVWYRLRIGPMRTRADAEGVCNRLKARGYNGCFVRPR